MSLLFPPICIFTPILNQRIRVQSFLVIAQAVRDSKVDRKNLYDGNYALTNEETNVKREKN